VARKEKQKPEALGTESNVTDLEIPASPFSMQEDERETKTVQTKFRRVFHSVDICNSFMTSASDDACRALREAGR
jgi:hypothetical protein